MNQALNQRDMFFKWLYYAGATLLLVLVLVHWVVALMKTPRSGASWPLPSFRPIPIW